jgi:hypothetical protein
MVRRGAIGATRRMRPPGAPSPRSTRWSGMGAVASAVARQVRRPPTRVREDRGLRLHGGWLRTARQLCGARSRTSHPSWAGDDPGTPGAGDRGPVDAVWRHRGRPSYRRRTHCALSAIEPQRRRPHRERVRGVVRHPRKVGTCAPTRPGRSRSVIFGRRWFETYADTRRGRQVSRPRSDALLHGDVRSAQPASATAVQCSSVELGLPRRIDARRVVGCRASTTRAVPNPGR